MRCRGAACRSRRCTNDSYRLPLKWQAPPNCHCEAPKGPWQSREGSGARVQGRRARENVAALSERHAGWQWLRHKFSGARPPDLSLRGRFAPVAISGRQRRSLYKAAAREKNVAALSERHAGWQWLRHKFSGARPPDLSLRDPEGAVAISQNPVESWESSGEIVTAFPRLPRRCAPRNDTSGWCHGAPAPLRG